MRPMTQADQESQKQKVEAADTSMRVAKRIAKAGVCSRRDAEKLIEEGRVAVNGKVLATPACVVTDSDKVTVDGKALPAAEIPRMWRYHKPKGLVTSHKDEQGRKTVFEALPPELPRVISVGRLDIATEGLLLLTTDGAIARHLELPSTGWLRRYRVRAYGEVADEQLEEIRAGATIDGIAYGPVEASIERVQGGNVWLSIGIREGKNREVKRLLEHLGLKVNRLIRTSFGPFQLGELAPGAVLEVGPKALTSHLGVKLAQELGVRAPTKQGGKRPTPGKHGKLHSQKSPQARRRAKR
ncbi:Ribosomal large subunit pseudouridine synthase B [Methyloligella halotolerans]|uniref:Pseudouridine synthase n=1 Tax=Methyloligella halotolerans TaxID=1177755 RepID=A0A1E2RYA6_9HYPH|nr:Ribosomal large subunit pseudouridine synthase B [Methyloligella halotolerans]